MNTHNLVSPKRHTITEVTTFVCMFLLILFRPEVSATVSGDPSVAAAKGLLSRMVPDMVGSVDFRVIPQDSGQDVFELQALAGRLVIGGKQVVGYRLHYGGFGLESYY